ncbi:MAG: 30S ribosomal protein S4 [Dehalococcoidia bacterium]|nr:30S ribosomal protein S4 [Dehalococcoidia bacterium]MCB9483219.1 30S ribosomal protein S4 [Dehalococcoidia bacterium]MCB9492347.1 30S ribosomal protein S4 [Dehalococcoidia bacterium]
MARYTGPKCRKCRRYGVSLCGTAKCALIRRQNPPGPRPTRRRKISDRGQQLIEKQKVRFAYGLMEGQFRRYYDRAHRRGGVAGNNLMQFLEERLDNVVYRLGFGGTRAQARQLVSHGLIAVDGKKLSIPSARVRVGQEISFTDRGKKSNFYKIVKEDIAGRDVPGWLEVNRDQLTGRMLGEPGPGDWEPHFNPNAVIEYYSR